MKMKSTIFNLAQTASRRLLLCTLALGLFTLPALAQSEDEEEEEVETAIKQPQRKAVQANYPTVTLTGIVTDLATGKPLSGIQLQALGYNYRITEFQAALGISQLKRLNWSIARRNVIAERYDEAFAGTVVKTPFRAQGLTHAFHLYIIQVPPAERKGLYDFLRTQRIYSQVLYIPAHLMPYYRQFGWKQGDMPVAEDYYTRCLALPMFPSLTDEEQEYVIDKVKEYFAK